MKIGVVYPMVEMETDPAAVAHYAQAVEEMGFSFVQAYDHVLGVNPASRPGETLPYNIDEPFMEPFVLFSYLASLTKTIEFGTGILILPQRQTVLVAKQAACLDVLCGGRFRLGIGTGWNVAEYEALGADFATRGKRIEEQVAVLREVWTKRAVTFRGEHHAITDAGILPMPVQQPIPIWFGGGSDRLRFGKTANLNVLRRIARLGDGWMHQPMPLPRAAELIAVFRGFVREYGRDPETVGVESRMMLKGDKQDEWAAEVEGWKTQAGATHLAIESMYDGLRGVDAHLKRLEAFRKAVPVSA